LYVVEIFSHINIQIQKHCYILQWVSNVAEADCDAF